MKDLVNFQNGVKNAYHIVGNDLFLMESACKEIENACVNNLSDVNRTVFNDENFNADELTAICYQVPMLSEKRFVLVKNISKISESDIKKIIQYSKNASDDCVLVLCELPNLNVFEKVDIEKIFCKKLADDQLRKIITDDLKEYGKSITFGAMQVLIKYCLKDLMLIKNEIKKLAFYGTNIESIDEDIVKKLVHQSDEFSVFEISDSLAKAQGDRAIVLLNKMLETKEFGFVLGLISSHFRRILYGVMSGGSDKEIADKLGVKEYAVTKVKQQAKNIKLTQLVKINELILDVDFQIKEGKLIGKNAMYYLIFAILNVING
ncbi:MAG: DNA polymerase III subunit delta [Clostridia bacterium]|nr:DNA polymerase III subunit delta [Clostridia bacterium]